jgi:hypothetical protein
MVNNAHKRVRGMILAAAAHEESNHRL